MKRTFSEANVIRPFWLFWLTFFYVVTGMLFLAWPYSIVLAATLAAWNPQHLQRTLLVLRKHHPRMVPAWNIRGWMRRNEKTPALLTVAALACISQLDLNEESVSPISLLLYGAGIACLGLWIWSYQIAGPDSPLLTAPPVRFCWRERIGHKRSGT